ncbi:Dabb family protein [Bradyrhizobium sp. 49]|uniref:Dabb family protein n=1 Tax=unclassified Bradyrhizobium TaxID=2631580 RepID=UPI001FF9453B|nr:MULTISPECIES: Dabb family protein [unclassified Bradyrhizobium]MCK1268012.1 Dabb family protein [Bradyrhizobium sp. 84]MCK1370349.1 Dabb family protein [Bradyrhizobium sp. 49]
MIRHIVFFTAKNKILINQIVAGLTVLTTIPHARRLEVAPNRKDDQFGTDIDIVVYGEFENEAELAAYKAHHLYQESIKRVRPLRELRFAADYNVVMDARFA